MYKVHHPKADIDRLYVKRKEGGTGLVQVEAAYKAEITAECLPLPGILVLSVIFRKHNFNKIKLNFHQYADSQTALYTLPPEYHSGCTV